MGIAEIECRATVALSINSLAERYVCNAFSAHVVAG